MSTWRNSLLYLLLAFAPIIRGGNRPLALLFLEILSLLLILSFFLKPDQSRSIPNSVLYFLIGLCFLPGLYLVPIPLDFWQSLAGHQDYALALNRFIDSNFGELKIPMSMNPNLTWYTWLALLPPVAVFITVLRAGNTLVQRAAVLFLVIACLEAILGLAQFSQGPSSLIRLGLYSTNANGTYANRDHLAGLLEMALPVAISFSIFTLPKLRQTSRQKNHYYHTNSNYFGSFIFSSIAVLIFLGLIFTQSRTGVMLSMFVLFISTVIFSCRIGPKNVYGIVGGIFLLVLLCALVIGLVPVLNRFTTDPMYDSRWSIFEATWNYVLYFFPWGSGPGTYSQIFQRFHPADLSGIFINHAHNDYLEWLAETGIFACILIAIFYIFYIVRWLTLLKNHEFLLRQYIQFGAGIGLLTMMLHSFVDFNLHIPANQIYFAFLAGLFFRDS